MDRVIQSGRFFICCDITDFFTYAEKKSNHHGMNMNNQGNLYELGIDRISGRKKFTGYPRYPAKVKPGPAHP